MKKSIKKIICFVLMMFMFSIVNNNSYTYAVENSNMSNVIKITSQPVSIIGKIGDTVEFKVRASGNNLTYKWQYMMKGQNTWKDFINGNTSTMKKVLGDTYDDLKVRVIVRDADGNSITSNTITVTLKKAPVITSQPVSITGKIGDTVEFKIGASGNNLTYKWQYMMKGQNTWKDFVNGSTSTMKKVLGDTYDDLKVRVIVRDADGNSVTSNVVNVTIIKSEDWELPIM